MLNNKKPKSPLDKLKATKTLTERSQIAPSRARASYIYGSKERKKPWLRADGTTDWSKVPWGESIARGVTNLPEGIHRAFDETFTAFKDWDVTAEALGTMAGQGLWKPFSYLKPEHLAYNFLRMASPGALPNVPKSKLEEANKRNTQVFDLLVDVYRQNYSLSDNGAAIKQYIAEEPAAFLEDAAMVATMFLGGSGALAKSMSKGVSLTSKQRASLNFARFARAKTGRNFGKTTRFIQNTFNALGDGAKYYGDRAWFIGTGAAEAGYEPGYWANLAHTTLNYMDPLSAPLLAAGDALNLTIGGIQRGIESGNQASRATNDFAEWLYENYEGWDLNSVEDLNDFMRTTHTEYQRELRVNQADQFLDEMMGSHYDFPQSDDIIRAKSPDVIAEGADQLTTGVEWEFLLDSDNPMVTEDIIEDIINDLDLDYNHEYDDFYDELHDEGVDFMIANYPIIEEGVNRLIQRGVITENKVLSELRERYPIEIGSDSTIEEGVDPATGKYVKGDPIEIQTTEELTGDEALKLYREFTDELAAIGAGVNESTGLHVHIGKGHLTEDQMANILRAWAKYEWAVDELYGAWRRENRGYHGTPSIYSKGLKKSNWSSGNERLDRAIWYANQYPNEQDAIAGLQNFLPRPMYAEGIHHFMNPEITLDHKPGKRLQATSREQARNMVAYDRADFAYHLDQFGNADEYFITEWTMPSQQGVPHARTLAHGMQLDEAKNYIKSLLSMTEPVGQKKHVVRSKIAAGVSADKINEIKKMFGMPKSTPPIDARTYIDKAIDIYFDESIDMDQKMGLIERLSNNGGYIFITGRPFEGHTAEWVEMLVDEDLSSYNESDLLGLSGYRNIEDATQAIREATAKNAEFMVSWENYMHGKIDDILGREYETKWTKARQLAALTGRGKLNLEGTGDGRITMEFRAMEGMTDGKRLQEYVDFLRYFVERFKDEKVLPSPRFGSASNNLESLLPGKPGQTWILVGDEPDFTDIDSLTPQERNIVKFLQHNNLDIVNEHRDTILFGEILNGIEEPATIAEKQALLEFYGSLDVGQIMQTAFNGANKVAKASEGIDPRKVVQQRVRQLSVSLDRGDSVGVIGRQVTGPEELAVMGQFVRNPSHENTWVVYVKDGKIKEHEVVTLNSSQETAAPKISQLRERVEAFEADGFLLLHNHPGGVAKFSDGDITVSNLYAYENSDIFMGAVVINSGTYAHMMRGEDGIYGLRGQPVNEQQLPSELVGWDTDSPYQLYGSEHIRSADPLYQDVVIEEGVRDAWQEGIANGEFQKHILGFGKYLNVDDNWITVAFTSADNRLEGLVEFRGLQQLSTPELYRFLSDRSESFGGHYTHIFVGRLVCEFAGSGSAVFRYTDSTGCRRVASGRYCIGDCYGR